MDGKVLILGSKGMLGGQLTQVFGEAAIGWDRDAVNVADLNQLSSKLTAISGKLTAIINCVAYNDVDGAEINQDLAFALNAEVPKNLAGICRQLNIPLVHFSTNYVFDGEKEEYLESDEPNPQSVYAKSKFQGEQYLISGCQKYYLIRTAVLFGPKGQSGASKKSFVELMLAKAAENQPIKAVNDLINSLTYVVDLSLAVKLLLGQDKAYGIYHITNSGQASWYEFAKEIFALKNIQADLAPVSIVDFPRKAPVPKKAVLLNTKLPSLRPWQVALKEFLEN